MRAQCPQLEVSPGHRPNGDNDPGCVKSKKLKATKMIFPDVAKIPLRLFMPLKKRLSRISILSRQLALTYLHSQDPHGHLVIEPAHGL
jgi:hypothetical protein